MRSLDFVMAYHQANIKTDIFMRVPRGCVIPRASQGRSVLKLRKNLYGLKDAGRTWHEYLRDGLLRRGFKQSQVDPCLFTKGNVLIVMYVDNAVVILPNKDKISAIIRLLQADYILTDDGDLRDYLGVRIIRDGKKVTMYQPKMTRQCLEVLSMPLPEACENKFKTHDTPATPKSTLHADLARPDRKCTWNYRAAVGVLNYLQAMTHPDISFAVHRCARHCNAPKLCHEQKVKRICRYLTGMLDKGLILQPDLTKGFECYVDADWAGNYNKSYVDEPSIAFSRTGYVVYYAGCPTIWGSKLQSIVALSTTEAEYVALSAAAREAITVMNLLTELRDRGVSIPFVKPTIRCRVFEDNAACVEVAKEPKLRPRTKHLAVRLHHFRDHVARGALTIHHVSTKEQIADIFTKPLPRDQFTYLSFKLMGC